MFKLCPQSKYIYWWLNAWFDATYKAIWKGQIKSLTRATELPTRFGLCETCNIKRPNLKNRLFKLSPNNRNVRVKKSLVTAHLKCYWHMPNQAAKQLQIQHRSEPEKLSSCLIRCICWHFIVELVVYIYHLYKLQIFVRKRSPSGFCSNRKFSESLKMYLIRTKNRNKCIW